MRKTLSRTLMIGATSLVATFVATSLSAAERTLKFHNGYAESRPEAGFVDEFAALVDVKSGGELKIDVYHAGSLGLKEPDMLRTLQRGLVDMALLYGEYYTRDAPELSAVYAQGAIKEAEEHLELLPTVREIYVREYGDWGIKTIGGVVSPVFDVGVHCKEPANSLEEIKDRKLRVWSSHLVDTFTRLGISAEVIPQNDMYMALQTGVVDCAYYLSTVAETVSLNEVTDYEAYLHPWAAVPAMFGVSQRTWESLSEDHRNILEEAGEEIWEKTREMSVDQQREAEARENRESLGVTILEPFSEEDVVRFQEAAFEAWEKLASRAGEDGLAIFEEVTGRIREIN
ncbi:TRAP transporter substrate-binding protein DctP [Billgrantia diversa]|uniref:TRAP transporter substrate-binding protein n=1 Tax=Halomonas sp. MCCC 1A13316 TaxID=2733487 RepID=UPI0018A3834E|nr:TRAP transporter substrate-binding protein [Halomonas sp. MCCC 1A13316]QOR37254.1 TRAP transporter substrate-binding protein DctP [Halomonas sp. MCCC 1A13316]